MSKVLSFLSRAVSPSVIGEIAPVPGLPPLALQEPPAAPNPVDQVASREARENLRAAKAAQRDAEAELQKAIEATERVKQVVRASDIAAKELRAAEEAYAASVTDWATNGAEGNAGSPELFSALEAIRTRARTAELAAKGARAALMETTWDGKQVDVQRTPQETNAREALRKATEDARRAAWPVLLAEIEPDLRRALLLRAELNELLPQLHGFARLCAQDLAFKGDCQPFLESYNTVVSEQNYLENGSNGRPSLPALMTSWRVFGEALLKNSEATFD